MNDKQKLVRLKSLLEALFDIPFTALELGLGEREVEFANARIWREIIDITQARKTCDFCGAKYLHEHKCNEKN